MTRMIAVGIALLAVGCFAGGETESNAEPSATYCALDESLTRACAAVGLGVGQWCDGKPTGDHVRAADVSDFDVARLPGAWCAVPR